MTWRYLDVLFGFMLLRDPVLRAKQKKNYIWKRLPFYWYFSIEWIRHTCLKGGIPDVIKNFDGQRKTAPYESRAFKRGHSLAFIIISPWAPGAPPPPPGPVDIFSLIICWIKYSFSEVRVCLVIWNWMKGCKMMNRGGLFVTKKSKKFQ